MSFLPLELQCHIRAHTQRESQHSSCPLILKKPSLAASGKWKEMEGKRAAAIAALCMLVMLSVPGQQQVAAMSEFCACYRQCYPGCRRSLPRLLCVLKCADDCSPNKDDAAAAACRKACKSLTSICGMSAAPADAAGAAACVHDCNKKWSHDA